MDGLFEQMTNISKAQAYDILREQVKELKEENERLKTFERGFYLNICRAYNAGKQDGMDYIKSNGEKFIPSDQYFKTEFPEFKINVP